MSNEKITTYPGKTVDVQWDERLCIHISECGRARGELFVGGRQPWCQPDVTTADEVAEVIQRCPSGALVTRAKDGTVDEVAAPANTVQVTYNGPLFVRGELDIEGAPADMPGVKCRAALCRCGKSANKPFCDNSHASANFKDFGAVGETGPGLSSRGGPLRVNCTKNGPFVFKGNLSLHASSGRLAWEGESVALCRCGASKNKPFCDGSHKKIGFVSEQG